MRFNERRTCVDYLDSDLPEHMVIRNSRLPLYNQINFYNSLREAWPKIRDIHKNKIQFISAPFYEAFERSREKVIKSMKDEVIVGDFSGTFIMNVRGGVTKTLFYYIHHRDSTDVDAIIFSVTKSGDYPIPHLDFYISQLRSLNDPDFTDVKTCIGDVYVEMGLDYLHILSEWVMMIHFLKYCDTEVKVIVPKEKHRNAQGVRYLNETKQKIEILDSTWFTTLVRSDAFKVRGHLRLQPRKVNGEWTKRWIWISDFEKHGYTRKAKKEM